MKSIVVGSGYIAGIHINAIRSIGHEVSWIVGRDEFRTREFASKFCIPHQTTNINEALSSNADIVHICTPPYTHAEIIRACLAANKHIICEKPLCIDPNEAEALAKEAELAHKERGIVSALCFNIRYYPAAAGLAEEIRKGWDRRAEVKNVSGSYLQQFHIPPHPDGWRFDDSLSEGMRAVTEIGSHWIDLAYYLTGLRITEVSAEFVSRYPVRYRKGGMLTLDDSGEAVSVSTEDEASVLLKFGNGAAGQLLLSEISPGHDNDIRIEITTDSDSYIFTESAAPGEPAANATFEALFRDVYSAADGATSNTAERIYCNSHPGFPTFSDGAYTAAVCGAILQSATSHGSIEL